MTIDKAIRQIDLHNRIHQQKEPRAVYITEAFDTLIGVAKKYQQIQNIINHTEYIQEDVIRYQMICEVIEDGNDD